MKKQKIILFVALTFLVAAGVVQNYIRNYSPEPLRIMIQVVGDGQNTHFLFRENSEENEEEIISLEEFKVGLSYDKEGQLELITLYDYDSDSTLAELTIDMQASAAYLRFRNKFKSYRCPNSVSEKHMLVLDIDDEGLPYGLELVGNVHEVLTHLIEREFN